MQITLEKASYYYAAGLPIGIEVPDDSAILGWRLSDESGTGRLAALNLESLVRKYYPEFPLSAVKFHISGKVVKSEGCRFMRTDSGLDKP